MSSAQFGQRDRPDLDPVIPPTTQGRDDVGLAYLAIPQLQSDATRLTVTMLYDLAGRPYQVNYPALASTHDTADVVFALRVSPHPPPPVESQASPPVVLAKSSLSPFPTTVVGNARRGVSHEALRAAP